MRPRDTDDVFNQTPPLEDFNAFDCDAALKDGVARAAPSGLSRRSAEYGARTGSAEVTRWGFEANAFAPRLVSHDRTGRRIDLVEYHESYHRLMSMALTAGIHSAPWVAPRTGAHVARAALVYLQAQVDAGHGCPLTMTFAAVPTLKLAPELADDWLPRVLANAYDPRNVPYSQKSALTIGMGMTEKQGGSGRAREHHTGHSLRHATATPTPTSSSDTSGSRRRRCATQYPDAGAGAGRASPASSCRGGVPMAARRHRARPLEAQDGQRCRTPRPRSSSHMLSPGASATRGAGYERSSRWWR
jgi:hypothetical protein